MAALAASLWTNWCLCSCSMPIIAIFDIVPTNQLDLDPLSPGWGGCISRIWWCGIEEEDDIWRKWEALKTIELALCQNWISRNQHVFYTQDEFCRVWVQVVGLSNHPMRCNKSVRCGLILNNNTMLCTTAKIAWLPCMSRTLFNGKNIGWYLSQIIPGIVYETAANNQAMLYG